MLAGVVKCRPLGRLHVIFVFSSRDLSRGGLLGAGLTVFPTGSHYLVDFSSPGDGGDGAVYQRGVARGAEAEYQLAAEGEAPSHVDFLRD